MGGIEGCESDWVGKEGGGGGRVLRWGWWEGDGVLKGMERVFMSVVVDEIEASQSRR